MKTVFNNNEIGHVFASRKQSNGRSNSMRFDESTFYSYAEPIGRFVGDVILLNVRSFSVTTNGHQSDLRHATSQFKQIEVGYLAKYGRDESNVFNDNKRWFDDEFASHIKKLANARAENMQQWHLRNATRIARNQAAYSELLQMKWKPLVVPTDLSTLKATIKIENKAKLAAKKEREAKQIEEATRLLNQWLDGGRFEYGFGTFLPTALRIKDGQVETSRGANFPIEHAKRGLTLVRAVMARGEEWRTNGHTCHLGHYQINRITPDGTVYAGCHTVPFASIERIASQLEVA